MKKKSIFRSTRFLKVFLSSIFCLIILISFLSRKKDSNVILITLDTQRADHISSYDSKKALTPSLDSLAQQGILFENCFSLIPITLPSHASLFYSQSPHKLGVFNNGEKFSPSDKKSLVEIFKMKGFQTGAFISLATLEHKFGLNKGFDTYDDKFTHLRWYLTAEEINRKVFQWIKKNMGKNFFLWIHYSDPHNPYTPPNVSPDFSVYLNDEHLKDFCLQKNEWHRLVLDLKKGENILEFEIIKKFPPHYNGVKARFDMMRFRFKNKNDIKVFFGQGIHIIEEKTPGGEKTIQYNIGEKSSIRLVASEDSFDNRFSFRGQLELMPEEKKQYYKAETEYMDGEICQLMNRLKEWELFNKTRIIIVGDHGEGLGEFNNHFGHIHLLYNVYNRVPLIIYSPFFKKKGLRISNYVTLLDVAPTILGLMGWKNLPQAEGRNILSNKFGKNKNNSEIYEETYRPQARYDRFGILKFPWHLIYTPQLKEYELFNLNKRPLESENVYQRNKSDKEIISLKKKINSFAYRALMSQKKEKSRKKEKVDKETLEILKSLGYIK